MNLFELDIAQSFITKEADVGTTDLQWHMLLTNVIQIIQLIPLQSEKCLQQKLLGNPLPHNTHPHCQTKLILGLLIFCKKI